MSVDNHWDDCGTDPETQRQALIRRSKVAHAPDEPPFLPTTTRPLEREAKLSECVTVVERAVELSVRVIVTDDEPE